MTSDFLLLQKIRNGNNHAGNQFVEKYYSFIYQYCFLHIHNQECAEDMVQETFVRFFGALMSGAEIGKAKSYLYSIAGNIIKNYYKKTKEILLDQLPEGYIRRLPCMYRFHTGRCLEQYPRIQ